MPADVSPALPQIDEEIRAPRPVVLVVEDEALVAMLIEDTLQDAGYDTILADSGQTALALAKAAEHLAAVVTDIHLMHGGDGRSIIRELRKSRPMLPTVVVTGFDKSAPEADLRGLGGPTSRLVKPFQCDELIASLAGVIASTNGRAPNAAGGGAARRETVPTRVQRHI